LQASKNNAKGKGKSKGGASKHAGKGKGAPLVPKAWQGMSEDERACLRHYWSGTPWREMQAANAS
jgi:hypothetical protein